MHLALSFCAGWRRAAAISAIAAASYACEAAASAAIDYARMMRLTVDGWVASQSTGGLFPYGFDFLADEPTEADRISKFNLIRQTGSAFVLAKYYEHAGDARLQEPIRRLLSAFGAYSLPIGKSRTQHWIERTHVLSLPFARWKLLFTLERFGLLYETAGAGKVVSPDGTYDNALAGAAALALLTELTYSHAAKDDRFAGLRSSWLKGLLSLRIPGGGFRAMPTSIGESDYFNGEGWLALAVYCDLHRSDVEAASALVELENALIERYSQNPTPAFYHWGAMAAAQRFLTTRDTRFLSFLQKQATIFLDQVQPSVDPSANHCAAMEGLAATLAVLNSVNQGDSPLAQRVRVALTHEASKLPKLQIQPGQTGMALGGKAVLRAPRMAEFPGAFLLGVYTPSTRVDAAQHCLSAMIMLERDRLRFPLNSPSSP